MQAKDREKEGQNSLQLFAIIILTVIDISYDRT